MLAYYMQWDGENPLLIGFIGLSGLILTAYFKRYDHTVLDVADENGKNHIVLNLSTIVNFVFLLMIFLIVYDARAAYMAGQTMNNGVFNIEV
jgi:hypothetical protein